MPQFITRATLVKRVNRKLREQNQRLISTAKEPVWHQFGEYCIVDLFHGHVIFVHCDLEKLARELNVLAPDEGLAD